MQNKKLYDTKNKLNHTPTEKKKKTSAEILTVYPTCFFKGVDEKTIIDILVKRSNDQRQQIKQAFQHSSGKVILRKKQKT